MRNVPITNRPVCVTGATGFIAAHVVRELLERGYAVRGTVRRAQSPAVDALRALPHAAERLQLVEADLRNAMDWPPAIDGCAYVLHTASPYALNAKDPEADLVRPAVDGTRHVLEACAAAGTVTRVVLTSSMAAITDEPDRRHVLTEADWNERSSLTRNPYYYSKTLAERAAWHFVRDRHPGFDLVVINPFMVIGPSLTPAVNTSNQVFVDLVRGVYPMIMGLTWGFVDVRDVALAHVLAMETAGASGRYLCANETRSLRELVGILRERNLPGAKLPRLGFDNPIGSVLVRLMSYTRPSGVGSYLRTHVGRVPRFSHEKIVRELGLTFRPLTDTIRDTIADLEKWGHLEAA